MSACCADSLRPQGVAWPRVGTSLAVRPTVLPGGQVKVRLAPWLSHFTPGGGGNIVTRRILGYHARDVSSETAIFLTVTLP